MDKLSQNLKQLPKAPGVYLMQDIQGRVLYIGKAKSIYKRVKSYFSNSRNLSDRIAHMISNVGTIDFIITNSEFEALTLEDNLIKEKRPFYNIMLKDDKNYPFIRITNESYPRLALVRKVEPEKGVHLGPYISTKAVRDVINMAEKIFKIRQSKDNLDNKPLRRPCLNYQIKRCLAPCARNVTKEEYQLAVKEAKLFLQGSNIKLIRELEDKMALESDAKCYEDAAKIRDKIRRLKKFNERQIVSNTKSIDEDIIGVGFKEGKATLIIYRVRSGKLKDDKIFNFDSVEVNDYNELLDAFIRQFYDRYLDIPPTIIVEQLPDNLEQINRRLSNFRGSKVKLIVPCRGRKVKMLKMARDNANLKLDIRLTDQSHLTNSLTALQERLKLPSFPSLIEGYDISNIATLYKVGVKVSLKDGVLDSSAYRKFNIKSVAGIDDYSSIVEVVMRRFRSIKEGLEKVPDLLVIDGGKGHLRLVIDSLSNIGFGSTAVIAIAKGIDRDNPNTDQLFYGAKGVKLDLSNDVGAMKILQQVRDEAHRFAIGFHRDKRKSDLTRSSLDEIEGIGPKRKKELLRRFGSIRKIKEAKIVDIMQTLKVGSKFAEKIKLML
ncbi:MAG: excinuclease ABC subunit UvrC [Nitrospinota bacterium]